MKLKYAIGKSKEAMVCEDRERGLARFGSIFRGPKYLPAYADATAVLFEHAAENGKLDEFAQPILYMQRHTLELSIKAVLWPLIEMRRLKHLWYGMLGEGRPTKKPSSNAYKALRRGHDLSRLLKRAQTSLADLGLGELPTDFIDAAGLLERFENGDPSRFRYPFVRDDGLPEVPSFKSETVVPIRDIQEVVLRVATVHCRGDRATERESAECSFLEEIELCAMANEQTARGYVCTLQKRTARGDLVWSLATDGPLETNLFDAQGNKYLVAEFDERRLALVRMAGPPGDTDPMWSLGRIQEDNQFMPCTVLETFEAGLIDEATRSAGRET